jgi:alcohol dehydrogenase class IV
MTQAEVSGWGAAARLGEILDRLGATSIFVVSGRASYAGSGAEHAFAPALAGRRVVRFCDFSPNPTSDEVTRGVAALRGSGAGVVIAVGGGSALDLAKLVNVCAAHPGEPVDYLTGRRRLSERALPLVAVPTTAGSGAEATHFATVYVDGVKHSAASRLMLPEQVILDPALTMSLPAAITASTGMDALAQGIESYWSVAATDASRSLAREAIERAARSLPAAVAGGDADVRGEMMIAANLAGKAIDVSRTTAPHALSYAITIGFGVPHGHAVGLTLAEILAYNAEVCDDDVRHPGGASFVRDRMREVSAALGCASANEAAAYLARTMAAIGLETRLRALGVTRADLPSLVRSVNDERLSNNPRRLPDLAIGRILDAIY